jgi:hypothetical protein
VTAYDEAGNGAAKGLAARAVSSVSEPTTTKPTGKKPTGKKPTGKPAVKPDATKPTAEKPSAKPTLTRPAAGARLTAPPVLAWIAVPRATYYNVQLYRNGRKVLTAWPDRPSFRLRKAWRFDGHGERLLSGTYEWYVWPGFGPRSARNYGKLIGTRKFVVTRR